MPVRETVLFEPNGNASAQHVYAGDELATAPAANDGTAQVGVGLVAVDDWGQLAQSSQFADGRAHQSFGDEWFRVWDPASGQVLEESDSALRYAVPSSQAANLSADARVQPIGIEGFDIVPDPTQARVMPMPVPTKDFQLLAA